jgi:hypothetical protein
LKLIHWTSDTPPAGFAYGPTPTDFGAGRAAYKYNMATGELMDVIYRGDYIIQHNNGEIERLEHWLGIPLSKVIELLRETGVDEEEI